MKRIFAGLLAVVAVAIAGFFGFGWYVQHRATAEVDAVFDQIRASGGRATHGKVAFDIWSRTLTVADVATESASPSPANLRIGNLTATGVTQSDPAHFSAATIDVRDIAVDAQLPAPSGAHLTYKAPQLVVKDYSGPTRLQRPPSTASLVEVSRALVEQFMTVSAASIAVPQVTATMAPNPAAPGGGEFTYSGFVVDDIKAGKIARYKLDEVVFTMDLPPAAAAPGNSKAGKMHGRVVDIVHSDIDTSALAAILDPDKAKDDHIYRLYRQATAGAYEITSDLGVRMRMDGISMDDVGVRPSKLQLPALLAAIPQPGMQPTPEQSRELLDKVASLYEGLQFGNLELRGLALETPEGPFKLAGLRVSLADGKGDLALEGFDGRSPQGPIKLGRFALKAFDIAGLMRLSAQFADKPVQPQPGAALAALKLIQGVELKALEAPFKSTNKPVKIDNVALNWGQFVGPIPTQAHLTTKMAGPVDPSNAAMLPLLAAGIDTLALDADLGVGWTEASSSVALSPVKIELANLLGASASLSLAHVPRALFTPDPQAATAVAAQIEAGGLELSLRDLGAIDLLVAQYARTHTMTREDAKKALVDSLHDSGQQFAAGNPDVAAAIEAVSRFIETPRQTLTLKLTPRAKVPALQLVQLLKIDPSMALAQFKIEASTGL
ncbi:hypothetical protein ACQR1W_03970 [Bradyrhizobium sp. HKCCYLS1011]|uniref:hypothetical protein n=1 Tax=Bradyrhizobium sp. HKCCYLS1011 TaxID=3420733 RepID=UPI003EC0497F